MNTLIKSIFIIYTYLYDIPNNKWNKHTTFEFSVCNFFCKASKYILNVIQIGTNILEI